MDKKLINEEINNIKYLFGYKPGRVISEQDIDYTTDDYLDVNETELDEYYYFPAASEWWENLSPEEQQNLADKYYPENDFGALSLSSEEIENIFNNETFEDSDFDDDYLDVNETELDEYYYFPTDDDSNHSKHPERLVKHNDTNKIVGTFKHGKGFHPSSHGEELGFEHHPTRIPHGTKFGGTEVGDFDFSPDEDNDHRDEMMESKITLTDYFEDVYYKIKERFDLTPKQAEEVIEYYRDDIELGFFDGHSVKSVIDSWVKDGKLKWKR